MKHQKTTIKTKAKRLSSSVLIIYTGGTFGMQKDKSGVYVPFNFESVVDKIPELQQLECKLTVLAFQKPIDSSNMTPEIWIELGKIIEKNYDDYDGFVVLHGTDTMAYSASALSFLLENLSKPVVFTGAQLPIGEIRTDAKHNFINALEVAKSKNSFGIATVPEVCILFDDVLLRGNRSKKLESAHFDAFHSENYPHLAKIGIRIEYNNHYILQQTEHELVARHKLSNDIALLKIFPGMSEKYCNSFLEIENLKGLVLETFGSGNAPTKEWFKKIIKKLIDKNVVVLNISQCSGGKVEQGRYRTSSFFNDLGVISGKDLTTEAAITKMMYLLGNYSIAKTKQYIGLPIRGEMS